MNERRVVDTETHSSIHHDPFLNTLSQSNRGAFTEHNSAGSPPGMVEDDATLAQLYGLADKTKKIHQPRLKQIAHHKISKQRRHIGTTPGICGIRTRSQARREDMTMDVNFGEDTYGSLLSWISNHGSCGSMQNLSEDLEQVRGSSQQIAISSKNDLSDSCAQADIPVPYQVPIATEQVPGQVQGEHPPTPPGSSNCFESTQTRGVSSYEFRSIYTQPTNYRLFTGLDLSVLAEKGQLISPPLSAESDGGLSRLPDHAVPRSPTHKFIPTPPRQSQQLLDLEWRDVGNSIFRAYSTKSIPSPHSPDVPKQLTYILNGAIEGFDYFRLSDDSDSDAAGQNTTKRSQSWSNDHRPPLNPPAPWPSKGTERRKPTTFEPPVLQPPRPSSPSATLVSPSSPLRTDAPSPPPPSIQPAHLIPPKISSPLSVAALRLLESYNPNTSNGFDSDSDSNSDIEDLTPTQPEWGPRETDTDADADADADADVDAHTFARVAVLRAAERLARPSRSRRRCERECAYEAAPTDPCQQQHGGSPADVR